MVIIRGLWIAVKLSVQTVRRKDCDEIYGVNTTNEMGVVILLYIISDWNILLFLFTLSQGWDGTPYQPQDIWHFALAISTFLALFVPCHYLSVVIRVHIWLLRTPGRGKFLIRVYMSWSTRYFCVSLGFCHIFVSFLIVIIYYLELLSFYFSIHFLLLSYICRDLFCLPLLSFLSLS